MTSGHIDFETYSELDLNKVGVYRYVEHPSTRILCMSWWLPDHKVDTWYPGEALPAIVAAWVTRDMPLSAWNAPFERTVWNSIGVNRHGFPRTSLTQWHDPSTHARRMNLPGSLDGAAGAVGLHERKDVEGKKLMRLMASDPKHHTPGNLLRLGSYCAQDVVVEHALGKTLGSGWPPNEQRIYWLSEKINDRGVKIDRKFVEIAATAVAEYQHHAAVEMAREFSIRPTQVQRLQKFCADRRVVLPDMRADTVQTVLDAPEFYPDDVVRILQMRELAGGNAPKKFTAMLRAVCADDRLRGMYTYAGAGQTCRWSGRIVQLQNLARPTMPLEEVLALMDLLRRERNWRCLGDNPMEALLNMVRPSLIPGSGGVFTVGDESQIEARVIAWLAGCKRVLDVFESGQDIYVHNAQSVPGADRPVGKVITLALGFGGGANAFRTMGRGYGVHVDEERAEEIKVAWRKAHPEYVALWGVLYYQARALLVKNGRDFSGYPASYYTDFIPTATSEEHYRNVAQNLRALNIGFTLAGHDLLLWLPSGRALRYPGAHIRKTFSAMKYQINLKNPLLTPEQRKDQAYMPTTHFSAPVGDKMVDSYVYGGMFSENLTQAIARDVLAEAMLRVSHKPIVLHSHDEAVIEGECVDALKAAMVERPKWAKSLPLDAKVTLMDQYWKD